MSLTDANKEKLFAGFSNPVIALYTHPTMRNTCRAKCNMSPGTTIISEVPASVTLLSVFKGKRCDACLRLCPKLQVCLGCKEMHFCDRECQRRLCNSHHKRLCRHLPTFTRAPTSTENGHVTATDSARRDVMLLLQLLASHYVSAEQQATVPGHPSNEHHERETDFKSPASVFSSLLPQRRGPTFPIPYSILPHITDARPLRPEIMTYMACRFRNNNFMCWAADMTPFASAVFPLASRLFNHSCRPNAVAVYEITPDGLVMEIRAVQNIEPGDEVTIAYLDPALPVSDRQNTLRDVYSFACTCSKCNEELRLLPHMTDMPGTRAKRAAINRQLVEVVLNDSLGLAPKSNTLPSVPRLPVELFIEQLPEHLLTAFNATYLTDVSTRFHNQSHDGPFDKAIRNGRLILALYLVHYPVHYPVIGIHCFELSKTIWNEYVMTHPDEPASYKLLLDALTYATWGRDILNVSVAHQVDGSTIHSPKDQAGLFVGQIAEELTRIGRP